MVWIARPKKTSGVATELTEDVVRRAGLGAGLVDIKVCAIDATWSGLKFVRRVRDRRADCCGERRRFTWPIAQETVFQAACCCLPPAQPRPIAPPDAMREGPVRGRAILCPSFDRARHTCRVPRIFRPGWYQLQPGPGLMRERMLARPAPADPLAFLLDWSPEAGAVARSGDLGFTTGPYSLRNQREPSASAQYGYFFSVWKRENGAWRVALDAGVSTPAAPAADSLRTDRERLKQTVATLAVGANWYAGGKEALSHWNANSEASTRSQPTLRHISICWRVRCACCAREAMRCSGPTPCARRLRHRDAACVGRRRAAASRPRATISATRTAAMCACMGGRAGSGGLLRPRLATRRRPAHGASRSEVTLPPE